jgi:hypothetical protein
MRPALQALAEQQRVIDEQRNVIRQQGGVIRAQGQRIQQHEQVFAGQRNQIASLGRGLRALASAAGIEGHVRTAMQRTADEQNPAQPIPEPPAGPPVQTTQEAQEPEAFADPMAPGLVPGSTNDVAADATTTAYTPGADIPGPAVKNLVDPTQPVDGTQNPRPLNEVRTLTDVRVGDPMNPAPAYPLQGDFARGQRLGSKEAASNRTMACLRLARLRIEAHTATHQSDFEEAAAIEKDGSVTDDAIVTEINAMERVAKAASAQKPASRPAGLVPRAASNGHRTTPSLQASAGSGGGEGGAVDEKVADADLFD